MLYAFLRPFATIALKVFLRKITLTHTERIPRGKPVILAANHPTAFMEPCVLACFLDRPLFFLVRGDIFVKKFYIYLLRALHMLPVYRLKDRGYKFVKANFETFDACYDALHACKTIMILAEGNTIAEKRLRPLKKGAARLAFGTIDKYPDIEDVFVVPVGVNFTYMDRFRAEVMVDFGEPVSARSYYARYYANNNEGIDAFTADLARRMKERIVCIDRKEDEALAEGLLLMARSSRSAALLPVFGRDFALLQEEMAVADSVNAMAETERASLAEKCNDYFSALERSGVDDRAVLESRPPGAGETAGIVFGAPLFTAGYLLNYIPGRIARYIADTRVRSVEFYAPVMLAAALVLYLIYYISIVALGLRQWGWWGLVVAVLVATAGYFAVLYRDAFRAWRHRMRWGRLSKAEKERLRALRVMIDDF